LNHATDKSTQLEPAQQLDCVDLTEWLKVQPKPIDVAFLPVLIEPAQLAGRVVVVADVLRATTTIIQALANGCLQVLPQPSIETARECHQRVANSVLGGERGGRIIPGFHQGNSPLEYDRQRIGGKTLILATTNGTVAMERCRHAMRILIGGMINLQALVDQISVDEPLTIVCSGTDGEITSEDTIFAGALVERILQKKQLLAPRTVLPRQDRIHPSQYHERLSDRALIALNHWQQTCEAIAQGASLFDFFRVARGGVNLVKIGMEVDIAFAAQVDTTNLVPELNVKEWAIRGPKD
jgi:2-phosphosulfolactate phosphatase